MEKLEITTQFRSRFKNKLNPNLVSIKYCQNKNMAFLEMLFINNPNKKNIKLENIFDERKYNKVCNEKFHVPMFNADFDIIDNTRKFLALDNYSLLIGIEGLFDIEIIEELHKQFLKDNFVKK